MSTLGGRLGGEKRPGRGRLGKPPSRLPQEDRLEKKLQGVARRQPGSGNQPHSPGDFNFYQHGSFLADGKTKIEGQSAKIETAWLRKVTREARGIPGDKTGIIILGFESITPPTEQDWAVIPLSKLLALVEAAGWGMEIKDD